MNSLELKYLALHKVGSKAKEVSCFLSKNLLFIDENMQTVLSDYFALASKSEEMFQLYHEEMLDENVVFACASNIFEAPETLLEQSETLAQHLFDKSEHPNIKQGEFFVAYFEGELDDEPLQAIGLFKSENKEIFLQSEFQNDGLSLLCQEGIATRKLDKGCIIYNQDRENGYALSVVDHANRGEALFWIDDFLQARQRRDSYSNTHDVLSMCKDFAIKELPKQFDVSRADQADFLNRSMEFFKDNDRFKMQDFAQQVIGQPEVIDAFDQYTCQYQDQRGIALDDDFAISEGAVKKQSRALKSVIKLDKNFHIYVHGNRNLIEQGEDDRGKFYKVYYQEES